MSVSLWFSRITLWPFCAHSDLSPSKKVAHSSRSFVSSSLLNVCDQRVHVSCSLIQWSVGEIWNMCSTVLFSFFFFFFLSLPFFLSWICSLFIVLFLLSLHQNVCSKSVVHFPSLLFFSVIRHYAFDYPLWLSSILSVSADIETIGEILLKIIPTLEEVSAFLRTCMYLLTRKRKVK